MWGSIFSYSEGKLFWKRPSWPRRTLTLYLAPPVPGSTSPDLLQASVMALGARAAIDHRDEYEVLPLELIRVWRRHARKLKAADSNGAELKGRDMLIRTLALRRMLKREVFARDESTVGLLLPPSVAAVVANAALAFDRRVAVNLNYTLTPAAIDYCVQQAGIRTVLSSAKFLEKTEIKLNSKVIALEDLKDKVSSLDKLIAFIQAVLLPQAVLSRVLGLNRVNPMTC